MKKQLIIFSVFPFLFSCKKKEVECEVTPVTYQSIYAYGYMDKGLIVRIASLPEQFDKDRCKGVFIPI